MKPATTIEEQIKILKSRGLVFGDEESAKNFLSRVNYYRFSGYAKLFYAEKDVFVPGTKFKDIRNAYYFDCELRNILNEILADIEISVRTQIAYNLANNVSPVCYTDPSLYVDQDKFNKTMKEIEEERKRKSRDLMVSHFQDYDYLPIWVAVEIASFGTLSKMFNNLKTDYRKMISDNSIFNIKGEFFENYLAIATILRNCIAHRERLYGKFFNKAPIILKDERKLLEENGVKLEGSRSTLFMYLFELKKLELNTSRWIHLLNGIERLINKYKIVKLKNIGFTENWKQLLEK